MKKIIFVNSQERLLHFAEFMLTYGEGSRLSKPNQTSAPYLMDISKTFVVSSFEQSGKHTLWTSRKLKPNLSMGSYRTGEFTNQKMLCIFLGKIYGVTHLSWFGDAMGVLFEYFSRK